MKAAVLPALDANIICGNTLVGGDGFGGGLLQLDDDAMRRLNPLDWRDPRYNLAHVLDDGGWDAVIGNPPYFSVDSTYGRRHPMLGYLQSAFPDVWQDKSDVLYYFLARAISVSKGAVGFIVSRSFLEAHKAANLRAFIGGHTNLRELVDFRGFRVFEEASIATAIVVLNREQTGDAKVRNLEGRQISLERVMSTLPSGAAPFLTMMATPPRGPAPWSFAPGDVQALLARLDRHPHLGTVAEVGKGMETGENSVFGGLSAATVADLGVSATYVRERIRNSDISRYSVRHSESHVLYLEDATDYDAVPANVQGYLEGHKDALTSRAAYERGNCLWWRYTFPLHRELYGRERIVCPYRAAYNRFALVPADGGLSLTDTTVIFPPLEAEDPRYILALLNSRLLTFKYQFIGKLTGDQTREYFWNGIARLPIRRIDFSSVDDRAKHASVVERVRVLEQASVAIAQNPIGSMDATLAERRFRAADIEIEEMVMDLYGVNDDHSRQLIQEATADVAW